MRPSRPRRHGWKVPFWHRASSARPRPLARSDATCGSASGTWRSGSGRGRHDYCEDLQTLRLPGTDMEVMPSRLDGPLPDTRRTGLTPARAIVHGQAQRRRLRPEGRARQTRQRLHRPARRPGPVQGRSRDLAEPAPRRRQQHASLASLCGLSLRSSYVAVPLPSQRPDAALNPRTGVPPHGLGPFLPLMQSMRSRASPASRGASWARWMANSEEAANLSSGISSLPRQRRPSGAEQRDLQQRPNA
jgi:hypothetical protein